MNASDTISITSPLSYIGMKPSRRRQVSILISELRDACRRPLFSEIVLVADRRARRKQDQANERHRNVYIGTETEAHSRSPRQRFRGHESDSPKDLPWEEVCRISKEWIHRLCLDCECRSHWLLLPPMREQLLARASQLAPVLTDDEHTEVLQLSSILLLGFLLPYSTGNEWNLLRGADAFMPGFDPVHYVLTMPLETRMAKSTKRFVANEYGEFNTLANPDLEIALDSFLFQGLGNFLSSRTVSRDKADLLHILALAICPIDSAPNLPPTTLQRLDKQNHPCWRRTKEMMRESVGPSQFCLSYGTRIKIIQIINDCISLPAPLEEQASESVAPLLFAAVPHLRSSLHNFAYAWAMSDADADLAQQAQAALARCNERTLREEWDFQLQNMCEGEVCHCSGDVSKCYYASRQKLLSHLCRPTSVRSRISAHALSSLSDALEWQMDIWTGKDDEADALMANNDTTEQVATKQATPEIRLIPCLLVSLLTSATVWFRTYSPTTSFVGSPETHDAPCATIFRVSLALVYHSDVRIRNAAMGLLEAALIQVPILDDKVLSDLYGVSTHWLALSTGNSPSDARNENASSAESRHVMRALVGVIAKRSRRVAASLLDQALQLASAEAHPGGRLDVCCSFIADIVINCPLAESAAPEKLFLLLEKDTPLTSTLDILAAMLSLRKTRYFVGSWAETEARFMQFFSRKKVVPWTKYKMARHAMLTGNFYIAHELFSRLCQHSLSERYFLWLSAMQLIALAEMILAKNASKGIPEASVKLRSALTLLDSLHRIFDGRSEQYGFITSVLLLRLDFLELLTILRHVAWEMRLTGMVPKKYSRLLLHLRNVIVGLVRLSHRYQDTIQCYGVHFRFIQSSISLGLLKKACLFLANAIQNAFSGSVVVSSLPTAHLTCSEDSIGTLSALMKQLQVVVDGMEPSIDPVIRAQAMIEITDGLLMVPVPIPADIFSPLQKPDFEFSLSADPEENDDSMCELDVIETSPSMSFTFICSGRLSAEILSRAPTVLLWYRMHYIGPVDEDEAVPNMDEAPDFEGEEAPPESLVAKRIPDVGPLLPASAAVLTGGRFCFAVLCPPLLDEGLFKIMAKLGCQDHLGHQWKLGNDSERRFIDVRVMRNR